MRRLVHSPVWSQLSLPLTILPLPPKGYALPLSTGSQKDLRFRSPHNKLQPTGGRALKGKGEVVANNWAPFRLVRLCGLNARQNALLNQRYISSIFFRKLFQMRRKLIFLNRSINRNLYSAMTR